MSAEPVITAPEPCPIVRAFGGKTIGYECTGCGGVYFSAHHGSLEDARKSAIACCSPRRCEKHDRDLGKRSSWCRDCADEREQEQEAKLYAAATRVALEKYDGEYLFREGFGRDGFFSVDDVEDMHARGECPEWAFGCEAAQVSEAECNLEDHVAEGILSDHHEDAYEWVDGKKVEEASRLIYEACKEVKTYHPEHSTVVILTGEAS